MSQNRNRRRAGMSLLELQVAFVLFGIALAGLAPLTVMQLRQLKKFEDRLSHEKTYYLVPSSDPWARKLGAAATITATAPESVEDGTAGTTVNAIEILSLEKSFAGQEVTADVSVMAIPK